VDWISLAQDRVQFLGSCRHGNKPSGCIKCVFHFWLISFATWTLINQLRNVSKDNFLLDFAFLFFFD
jgi:hypothetical protein